MDSIDMIFDMLLEPGQYDSLKISKLFAFIEENGFTCTK
jgi:hypothetical protein